MINLHPQNINHIKMLLYLIQFCSVLVQEAVKAEESQPLLNYTRNKANNYEIYFLISLYTLHFFSTISLDTASILLES